MFARINTFEGSGHDIDEAIRVVEWQILPLERTMAGFRGLIVLTDREAGRLVSLTLWETEELMEASDESARLITRLAAQMAGGKRRATDRYEVALFETRT